jgi:hypothetical protein
LLGKSAARVDNHCKLKIKTLIDKELKVQRQINRRSLQGHQPGSTGRIGGGSPVVKTMECALRLEKLPATAHYCDGDGVNNLSDYQVGDQAAYWIYF